MKPFVSLTAALLVAGCSPTAAVDYKDLERCWNTVPEMQDRVWLLTAEALYLRGEAVIIPSFRCRGERMQAIGQTQGVRNILREIEHRNTQTPLGFRATILARIVRRASPRVVEVELLEIKGIRPLDRAQSESVLKRLSEAPSTT